jgi:Spy/CpxP family protein refolding chaperone
MRLWLLLLISLPTIVAAATSPYAGWQTRAIKALSAEQIDDLRNGRGMSLALPAELNGYPGPKHILELSDQLGLSPDQVERVRAAFAAMRSEAQQVGAEVLEAEQRLEALFASGRIDENSLATQVEETGRRWSRLRTVHLKYHLSVLPILTPQQRQRYQMLRGYDGEHHGGGAHDH